MLFKHSFISLISSTLSNIIIAPLWPACSLILLNTLFAIIDGSWISSIDIPYSLANSLYSFSTLSFEVAEKTLTNIWLVSFCNRAYSDTKLLLPIPGSPTINTDWFSLNASLNSSNFFSIFMKLSTFGKKVLMTLLLSLLDWVWS